VGGAAGHGKEPGGCPRGPGRWRAGGVLIWLRRLSPGPRTLEVPYAYQCCAYSGCPGFFTASGLRGPQHPPPDAQDPPKRTLADRAESRCE